MSPIPRFLHATTPILLASLFACSAPTRPARTDGRVVQPPPNSIAAPPTERGATVDDYHGTAVADPYRWLEDQDAPATAAFVQTQNQHARSFLDAIPERAAIRARLEELWNFPRQSPPRHRGKHWFWSRNDGLQNQPVWLTADQPTDAGTVLLDPNQLSTDGTVALAGFAPSEDGSKVAYAVSSRGSDWQEWRVLDTASRQPTSDVLRWAKFTTAAWTTDGRGFFYQRYPAPKEGEIYQAANKNAQLCYHVLGTAQADDRIVYERPDEPEWGFSAEVTDDGRYAVIAMRSGTDRRNRIALIDLQVEDWPVVPFLMDFDAHYDCLGHDGDAFWFLTDQDAPRGRIVAIHRQQPREPWRTLVPEQIHTLQSAQVLGGHFAATYLTDAAHRIAVHALDGTPRAEWPLPALGSVAELTGRPAEPIAFVSFQSFLHAPTILRHDFASGRTTTFLASAIDFDASRYVAESRFLQSRDGTRLCLFLVHKAGLALDGSHPTYLYGYGGFSQSLTPRFSVPNLVFVERGGIYAQAVLRGGGEYGEHWHRAGMRDRKQNVFDDFVACGDYLLRNGYTSAGSLAIGGGSNGGLLVGAVLTQHPERFGAAIPEVGVLDMLRYHQFTIGAAWASEYGRSDDAEQFRSLFAYSPLHNVRTGTHYTPTLVMTGDHDDRVLPGHSYKFAAALQHAQGGDAPILLRVESSAGHGAGKPIRKLIDEAADRWAFLTAVLGKATSPP